MKIALFDFQKDALHALRDKLVAARRDASVDNPQAVAFSAPTGSGKTIVMTALFEAILDAPDDQLDWPATWRPQHDAVILWVSDMPELNEQTRLKLEAKSDRVYRVNQLVTIDSAFDAERLAGGRVYFVNTQKLGHDKLLTKEGDGRSFSIWRTLSNTARAIPDRFYVVIDEAHRGMTGGRGATEARTLMQRFLLGHPETGLLRMPIVIGVSATPKRFMDLLEHAPHTVHKVAIAADEVRRSGLLKDRILIHHPDAATRAEMALLEEAARRWASMTADWADYCSSEGLGRVWPVLVVQVDNAAGNSVTRTNLDDALNTIERAIGRRLNEGEVAHAMDVRTDLLAAGHRVRWVEASRIDSDRGIGVVFFKTSLSTGWDCPRAEVMMSFRRAEDHTYIAQLLGRMVRTPLARRIDNDAALNDVHLFLPHFNAMAVTSVVESLHNVEDVPPAETGDASDLRVLDRRAGTEAVFAALDELVTYRVGAVRAQSALRRYIAIARQLTVDEIDDAAWDAAKAQVVAWIGEQAAAMTAAGTFEAAARAVARVGLKTLAVTGASRVAEPEAEYEVEASDMDIERLFDEAGRAFGHGLHMGYWQAHAERDATAVKIETIVVSRDHGAMTALQAVAGAAFDGLYDGHKRAFGRLPEGRRLLYSRLRLATARPSEVPWRLPLRIDWRRAADDAAWERHLFVDPAGSFRAALGAWEADVLNEELARPEVVGWLRNLPRKPWSLEVPYETGSEIKPMFPDLVVVRKDRAGFVVDVLEPHDPSLADNVGKAKGLARFAERHGALFGRIQLIRKLPSPAGGRRFRRLDVNQTAVTERLLLVTTNAQLDAMFSE